MNHQDIERARRAAKAAKQRNRRQLERLCAANRALPANEQENADVLFDREYKPLPEDVSYYLPE